MQGQHLWSFLATILLAMGLLAGAPDSVSAQQEKPNILAIWGDDIGQSNISAYTMGLVGYRTPNIDRLAREGTDFHRFTVASGVSSLWTNGKDTRFPKNRAVPAGFRDVRVRAVSRPAIATVNGRP